MKKIIYTSITACLFLASCSSIYAPMYAPSSATIPLHTQKDELLAEAKGGTDNYALQGSFSVTDHINVFANGSYLTNSNTSSGSYKEYNTKSLVEGGLGYFTKIDDDAIFEIQAGYGQGFSKNLLTEKGKDAKALESVNFYSGDYNRIFIQPSIGVILGKNETFAVGAKVSKVNFTRFATTNTSFSEENKPEGTFLEPHLQYRGTWNKFSLMLQTGFSLRLSKEEKLGFDNSPAQATIGLGYRLDFNKGK